MSRRRLAICSRALTASSSAACSSLRAASHSAPDTTRGLIGLLRPTVGSVRHRQQVGRTRPQNSPPPRGTLRGKGSICQERVEHLPHWLRVAVHDRCGCLYVPGGVKVLPVQREPCLSGQLLEEGPLGPPVTLTERMNRVDLAKVEGQPVDERGPFQPPQEI